MKQLSYLLSLFTLIISTTYSCSKPAPGNSVNPPSTDSIQPSTPTPTPQQPPASTFSNLLKQVDIYYQNEDRARQFKGSYIFEYDNNKRVTAIKDNFSSFYRHDTIIYSFTYVNNNLYPSRCVFFNKDSGLLNYTYDTIYFQHDNSGKLIKDSLLKSMYNGNQIVRVKHFRKYEYSNSGKVFFQWWAGNPNVLTPTLNRVDSVILSSSGNIQQWKTELASGANYSPATAILEGLSYSGYINPYSLLNISGFPSYLYEGNAAKLNILGNHYYYAATGSNMIAIYMDLVSKNVLHNFWYTNYIRSAIMNGNFVKTVITPDSTNPNYPAKFLVTATMSLAGDEYEYKFTY